MAKINGQIVICDRCNTQIFLKCTGEGEADGGYTQWNEFEPMPEGWEWVAIPKVPGIFLRGNAHNDYLLVCPSCHELWKNLINEKFLRDTPFYGIKEETLERKENEI